MIPSQMTLEEKNDLSQYILVRSYLEAGDKAYSEWKINNKWPILDPSADQMANTILDYLPNDLIPLTAEETQIWLDAKTENFPNSLRKPEIVFRNKDILIEALNSSHPDAYKNFKDTVDYGLQQDSLPGGKIDQKIDWNSKLTPGLFFLAAGVAIWVAAPFVGVTGIWLFLSRACLALGSYIWATEVNKEGKSHFQAIVENVVDDLTKNAKDAIAYTGKEIILPIVLFAGMGLLLFAAIKKNKKY